jgi:S-adenosylmethionine:tRNA ribosyltransferase-isomerase
MVRPGAGGRGTAVLRRTYAEALGHRYLWHEFGDVDLLIP